MAKAFEKIRDAIQDAIDGNYIERTRIPARAKPPKREPMQEPKPLSNAEKAAQEREIVSVVLAQRAKFGVGKNLTKEAE